MTARSKTCSKCKIEKPTEEFFRRTGRAAGVVSRCKTCSIEDRKVKESARPPYTVCSLCKLEKSADQFYGAKKQCKSCLNLKAQEKKDEKSAYNKAYREKNRDRIAARLSAYYEEHKDQFRERGIRWRADCSKQIKEAKRRYYLANKAAIKSSQLEWAYGITLEEYNEMLKSQQECCKICRRHRSEFKKGLFVDHDHVTGKVRGLLCPHCNSGIGYFKDDTQTVEAAAEYLRLHKETA